MIIEVYYTHLLMGRLGSKGRDIFFEYDAGFLKTGLELSPFQLPLKPGLRTSKDPVFEGLFGVFNDSLPDGWGRLLLDRKLMKQGLSPEKLSPLDRLCYVGKSGLGALSYRPEIKGTESIHTDDLDEIYQEISDFQDFDDDTFVDDLLSMNASSTGVRPKILMGDWIIKFKSPLDPKDIGPIEYAYNLMAKAAGLRVPEAKLFLSKNCPGYFGVKRFDKTRQTPLHMHTMSGLLHADHRLPSLDYETILQATLLLTKDMEEVETQFKACVFNALSHNRDDHAKNFSFLMDNLGKWSTSPAYDLTFSAGPSGEHCTTFMGEGKTPILSHLLKLGKNAKIPQEKTLEIILNVQSAVLNWTTFAKDAGVSKHSSSKIKQVIDEIVLKFNK